MPLKMKVESKGRWLSTRPLPLTLLMAIGLGAFTTFVLGDLGPSFLL